MIILNCNDICHSYGINTVLKDISFCIHDGDKVGIVGVNGAGKSTLLNIINGELQCDSGTINISKNYKIGFLHQNTGLDTDNTIFEEMLSVFQELINKEERLKVLEKEISKTAEDELNSLVKEYSRLSDEYSLNGGYEYRSRVKGVLKGLGFNEDQFDIKIHILSGGQKTRLALAKLLLSEPDIMLLDEPTNHLDIEAIMWLESFLKTMKKTVLIVSHDRYFLDSVTTKTLELENNSAKLYNGNYTQYLKQKEVDREIQQRHYENQQREIEKMEAFITQQKQWNRERNIIAAESRQKAIDRMEKIEKPKDLPGKINIRFRKSIISGNDVMFVEKLSKSYPGKKLFSDISFKVKKNERVFLLGPNGCGKSTLVKILISKLQSDAGVVEFGHKVNIGYYDQELNDLDESKTILEELIDSNNDLTLTQIRTLLSSFLFTGEDVLKPISTLSGGEKSRVALAKLILSSSNFLILDEPTNHLDINSREVLEEALANYEGTILSISHDRYFINKLATRILDMDNCSLLDLEGNYDFFIDYKNRVKKSAPDTSTEVQVSQSKLDYKAEKEERARIRKLEKRYSEIENKIADTEERLKAIDQEMFDESTASDHSRLTDLLDEQIRLNSLLEELYSEWESITTELGL
ncbi:ABC-F family ATP-binding cassette domain-containing protein [Pseudobacteroides cellulosolvens]|uniref:ABC-F family ATP-binding cassette domain-containing protein n=1 Tax=Pseudobacteroides cellulosolvens TaxID=35825 RepID=UPI0005665EDC|nr:ABC-F type ribosomal protection protein [Pseudobacteroides cellulosolvens]